VIAGVGVSALAYTIACPPYEWWPAAWIAPGLLLVACRRLTAMQAFFAGCLFAILMGFGVTGWAVHASLEYFEFNRALASAFAVCVWLVYGGPAYGLMLAAYATGGRRLSPGVRSAFGAWLWVVMELARATLFTGMPWELLGHSQFRTPLLVQVADLGGVYAVSFVIAFVSTAVAELAAERAKTGRDVAARLAPAGLLVLAVLAYGLHCRDRFAQPPDRTGFTVAVVQGNIPNAFRWKRTFFERTIATYAGLTAARRADRPDLVVWPENAVNFYVDREPLLRAQLGSVAALATEGLLVGAPRLASDDDARNAAYLIGPDGDIRATYDKRRLVPFAEYNPFPTLGAREPSGPVYTAGDRADPLRVGAAHLGTLICYEVLFPSLVRDLVRRGADVLVNLSNDSWLDRGDGAAPRQHFSMAIFRAIETRRYLIRAAASGTSGFVTPYGEPYGLVPPDTAGSAVARVEARTELTPYVRWGESWIAAAGGLVALTAFLGRRREDAPVGVPMPAPQGAR